MAFMIDKADHLFIAVRWYKHKPFPPNAILELLAFDLAPEDKTASYSVLPVDCIVNGALLIKCEGTFWAVQSPRELAAYIHTNLK
jgi:hypothetical protein